MIKDKVVFVLGAGASIPFGFPSGSDLVRQILSITKDDVPKALGGLMCAAVCREMHFDDDLMLELQMFLSRSQVDSIDEFLAQQTNARFMELGRFLIAAQLIPHEDSNLLFQATDADSPRQNWYRLIWRHLADASTMEAFLRDVHLTFITFNYDRSLEHYLWTVLRHYFDAQPEQIREFFRGSIFHVHGMLGAYHGCGGGKSRPYKPCRDLETVKLAMSGIKVVHEVSEFSQKSQINKVIEAADRIVFLGCSYNAKNLAKLFEGLNRRPGHVFGTSFGLSNTECEVARRRIASALHLAEAEVKIGGARTLGCYDYLREHFSFS